ncbi:MAG TPA: hypothetical protein VIU29_02660 [Candidatus Deferrimicrobiaceae bacterium]
MIPLLAACPAFAEGRTVEGTIVRVDVASRALSVKDGLGTVWNFTADRNSGIDLRRFGAGRRVSVTIRRATPLNMSSVADRIRKGDRVVEIPPGQAGKPAMGPPLR